MNIRRLLLLAVATLAGLVALTTGHGPAFGSLVPLLPLAAITGHSGLLTYGFTGAALLKLKAAAAIAAFLALRRTKTHAQINLHYDSHGHKESLSHGQKHGGGWKEEEQSGGWNQEEQGGYQRRRRSAQETTAESPMLDLSDYGPSLDEVLQYDQLGCGMRLVCELSAAPAEALYDDERIILELFGRGEKAPNPAKASRGKLSYSYAALLGENAKDSTVCSNVYGRCPYSAQQVMHSLREANV